MRTLTPPASAPQPLEQADRLPALAASTQLLGAFEGDAFEDRPYLLRRGDGQIIQISRLLYALTETLPQASDLDDLARRVSADTGREVSSDNAAYLLTSKLRPLGVLADTPTAPATKPLLSLRFRVRVVPEPVHRRLTTALCPLFHPPVVIGILTALVLGDLAVFLAGTDRLVGGVGAMIDNPSLLLILLGLTLATAAFHETGHATATRYGGATPGVMGAGIYLVWPVFYTDVTDAYRLDRRGRLRTDLGGVYFNTVMLVAADAVYLTTHFSPLLVFIVVTHLEVLYQFLPFVRLDGYWVLSDLIGVPNLFAYLAPITARLTGRLDENGRRKLRQLRPWARRAITTWVALTLAILATNAVLITWIGPHILRLTYQAGHTRITQLTHDVSQGHVLAAIDQPIALLLGTIPAAGLLLLTGMLVYRAARTTIRWWPTRRPAALTLALATAALLALQIPHLATTHPAPTTHPTQTAAAAPDATPRPPSPPTPRPAPITAAPAAAPAPATAAGAQIAATPNGHGYWTTTPDGSVQTFGDARYYGSAADTPHPPVVAMAATPDGRGYWLAADDGAVYTYGDAAYHGGVNSLHLNQPITGITPTPSGHGYWLVASDGGVFSFGDARYYGSGADTPHPPVVAMAATPDGRGYWLAADDGAVYAYGDAAYHGGVNNLHLNQPITGITPTPSGHGYWLVASDGGVFSLGDAPYQGSAATTSHPPIIGLIQRPGTGNRPTYQLLTMEHTVAPVAS